MTSKFPNIALFMETINILPDMLGAVIGGIFPWPV
jgi:hypothetical protein